MPRPLVVAFNTLILNVLKTNNKVSLNGIKIKTNDGDVSVTLSVCPLILKKGEEQLLLVTFSDDKLVAPEINDEGTAALMSDNIREQEKLVWMYSAYLHK